MKKIEIFGLWLCLLGIFLLVFGGFDNAALMVWVGIIAFVIGSVLLLSSLWNRRKDP